MAKKLTGLNTYIFTYSLKDKDKYKRRMSDLSKTGKVTELFVCNKWAFEWKKYRMIGGR